MLKARKYLIVVTGPTAVGKTAFSVRLANHYDTEILSADSRQFYREMRIGTAYPEAEELMAVPHHFIGNLSVTDAYNVSRYENEALDLLELLYAKKDVVVLTGGSGLYIDAVCKGIDELPEHDPALRKTLKEQLKNEGLPAFGKRLQALDPEYYEVVDQNNPNRLLRAMEVCIQTGQTYTSLRKNKARPRPFGMIKIGLNMEREALFRRIGERVDTMMEKSLLEEVNALLPFRGYNALNTVGYKELFSYIDGNMSLEEAVDKIKTNTRRYARRQLTWFKRDAEIQWFNNDDFDAALSYISKRMQ
ncbi:MAG: tRNA (adenosine(37)-N6)-dimethylallyltransferase MiaA [Bacteroidales bacterium]|nr:tRNA (adenosine(37)-N6)-dimethylallyltransferase MiaA [Bacteroidales bacterium]